MSLYFILGFICICVGSPPPVKNFTTIELYTDPKTWNEATQVCDTQGGKILDITYYSLFSAILTLASDSPWKDLPITNGPPAWIGLHRRVTPLGDMYYSQDCQRLKDFQVVYWNSNSPYDIMDGDPASFCVYHQIDKSTTNQVTSVTHDYTRGNCQEQHPFYCVFEQGSCFFEMLPGYSGVTSQDFTPSNDEIYPFESNESCKEQCLNSGSIYPHPDLRIVEECWGFTTSATECRLHNVLKPSYFDSSMHMVASSAKNLFIKRCFSTAVNTDVFSTLVDDSPFPSTNCGTPEMGNSTMTAMQAFVYMGKRTWNEAFKTCADVGLKLLQIQTQDDYTAIQQLVTKYSPIQSMDYIWISLHVPDPVNHTNTRVWSDCSSPGSTNWDPSSPPSTGLEDTAFCTVLDTSSNFWYTTACNEPNYFICTGDYVSNRSYSNGIANTLGVEISLGPYNVTHAECRDMCSTLTYEDQECWGYATSQATAFSNEDCFLYFINSSNPNTITQVVGEQYTLFIKMTWPDTVLNMTDVVDSNLIPASCCDVTGLKSECPKNNPPLYSDSIPTTTKVQFVLYRNQATWNEALSACKIAGGKLLELTDVSKRLMIQRYMDAWITSGYISDSIWSGLFQFHFDDPCSLRWAGDCSVPTWTDFTDGSYTDFSTNFCTAVDTSVQFVKKPCNQTLPFVCEINAGVCGTEPVVSDINCNLGPDGALLTVSGATCLSDCGTMTLNNMECWAAVMVNPNTCHLMFYIDPEYCKEDSVIKKGYDVYFKTCYSATEFDISPVVTPDDSPYPKTSCSALISVDLNLAACVSTSSKVPTVSTALFLSLSSMLPPVPASSFTMSSSVLATASVSVSQHASATISVLQTNPASTVRLISTSSSSFEANPSSAPVLESSYIATSALKQVFDYLAPVSLSSSSFTPVTEFLSTSSTFKFNSNFPSTSGIQHVSVSSFPTILSASPSEPVLQSSSTFSTPTFVFESISTSSPALLTVSASSAQLIPSESSFSTVLSLVSSTEVSTSTYVSVDPSTLVTDFNSIPASESFIDHSLTPMSSTELSVTTTGKPTIENASTSLLQAIARPIFIWPCLCYNHRETKMAPEEWQEWIVLVNTIDKHSTSRNRRKRTSVKDHRTSSSTIGMIGAVILVSLAVCLIAADIPRLFSSAKYLHINKTKTKKM